MIFSVTTLSAGRYRHVPDYPGTQRPKSEMTHPSLQPLRGILSGMQGEDLLVDRSPVFAGLVFHPIDGLLEGRYNRSRRVRTEREILLVCREGADGNIGTNRPFFEHQNERPDIVTGYDEQDKNGKINRSSPAICSGFLYQYYSM